MGLGGTGRQFFLYEKHLLFTNKPLVSSLPLPQKIIYIYIKIKNKQINNPKTDKILQTTHVLIICFTIGFQFWKA